MRVVGISREESARSLLLSDCPRIDKFLAVGKCIVDRSVKGGLKMQEFYLFATPPVLEKDGFF